MKMRSFIAFQVMLAAALLGCKRPPEPTSVPTLTLNGHVLQIEVASSPQMMARGLMFRKTLPENAGMLFVFESPRQLNFWMKNTAIPLDLAYFDASGTLEEIFELYPYDTRSVVSVGHHLLYALEVNQGWLAAHGVTVGATLDTQELKKAAEAGK